MAQQVQRVTRKFDYSDLDLDFIAHPTTGDVVKKKGIDALKRSVRNLILTNFYDRKFRSYIGSNAQKILFDNINPFSATFLKDAIVEVITNYEPRVKLAEDENDGVIVSADIDNNGYNARITFSPINTGAPVTISLFLERIR
jgi:phage baseplate assembly protein W